jgi:hypothetical protein
METAVRETFWDRTAIPVLYLSETGRPSGGNAAFSAGRKPIRPTARARITGDGLPPAPGAGVFGRFTTCRTSRAGFCYRTGDRIAVLFLTAAETAPLYLEGELLRYGESVLSDMIGRLADGLSCENACRSAAESIFFRYGGDAMTAETLVTTVGLTLRLLKREEETASAADPSLRPADPAGTVFLLAKALVSREGPVTIGERNGEFFLVFFDGTSCPLGRARRPAAAEAPLPFCYRRRDALLALTAAIGAEWMSAVGPDPDAFGTKR